MKTPDILQDFLSSTDTEESHALLEGLMGEYAVPVIQRIVASRVREPASEDVQQDVAVGLIARLRDLKGSGAWSAIGDFDGYIAVAAYQGCREYYRRRYPQRTRLRARLRYVLGRHQRFTIWKTPAGTWLCGPQELSPVAKLPRVESKLRRPASHKLTRWLENIFEESTPPLAFEDLLERAGQDYAISGEDDPTSSELARPAVTIEMRLTHRARLRELWTEIGYLPAPQRVALLLSIRDDTGGPGLALFPAIGAANLAQIAERLAMPMEHLAQVWSGLPLSDHIIGEYLNLDSQRVINLRKSARERLNRKMNL